MKAGIALAMHHRRTKGGTRVNIAAYCRVSTDKDDQLNSLATQKQYFQEYAQKNGHNLVQLYADEGISGTKTKNRHEFLRMIRDAQRGQFEQVVVKDISRLARNTVDLLENTRKLKALGIGILFLTANMTTLGDSEFVLTMFGALAQEESSNTSKRIKFGKRSNAEKGRVPNLVFGYEKIHRRIFPPCRQRAGGCDCAPDVHMVLRRGLRRQPHCRTAKRTGRADKARLPMVAKFRLPRAEK